MAFPQTKYDVVLVSPPPKVIMEYHDEPDSPAIGIAYVGNYLEKHGGVSPALIDGRFSRISLDETVQQIIALRPKIVGLSAFTHMITLAGKIAEQVKAALPGVQLVLGGFHATFLPERTLQEFPVFDYLVAGEGEIAFMKLVQGLLAGDACESIQGVCFQKDGRFVNNQRGEIPEALDDLGEPGWHLYDQEVLKRYYQVLPVITQRGCPFGCNFCSRPYGQLVRKRSSALVINEIEANVKRYSLKKVDFYDETFSVNKKMTKELCEEMIKRNIIIEWMCTTHVNTVDEELIEIMKKSGCGEVRFGVESGNVDIIDQMGKKITKQRIVDVHKMFRKAGVKTTAFFIFGHPGETRKTIWDTIRFAVKINADSTSIGILVPYPGTKVWDMAARGLGGYKKLSSNWDDYNKQIGDSVELENISRRQLEIAQVLGYTLIYVLNFRFKDFYRMFREHSRLAIAILSRIFSAKTNRDRPA